jgi:hypothetical protein
MISKKNIITLPRNCFSVVVRDYSEENEKLVLHDLYIRDYLVPLKTDGVEEIVNDKSKKLYCNLHVRKNLQVDAQVLSGAVQALTCDYHIFTFTDMVGYAYTKVKEILEMSKFVEPSPFYAETKRLLSDALDFEIIDEEDYVRLPFNHVRNPHNTQTSYAANWSDYRNFDNAETMTGFIVPKGMPVIHIRSVLKYAKNRGITPDESRKIRSLLQSTSNEKVAVTLMNTFNPEKSFVELMCLINHISQDIGRNIGGVPVLPFMTAAYGVHTKSTRQVDTIVKEYVRNFGNAEDDILERIADAYSNPNYEESSVFDFKLKIKRR